MATPVNAAFGAIYPTYWAASEIPARLTGPGAGMSIQFMDREVWPDLFFNESQVESLTRRAAGFEVDTARRSQASAPAAVGWLVQWNFFLGSRVVTESSMRHSKSHLGLKVPLTGRVEPLAISGRLNFWEYAGSLRYNVSTGLVQPYVKLGYGSSWYRLEDVRVDGDSLAVPDGPWIRKPSLFPFRNILPNTWHYGFGVEVVPVRRRGRLPGGTDLAVKVDYTAFRHSLGLTFRERARFGIEENPKVSRGTLNILAVVTF